MVLLFALAAVDFQTQVRPVLESACLSCHGPEKAYGGLRVDSARAIAKSVVAGDADRSPLLRRALLAPNQTGAMPPGGPQLKPDQIAVLRAWIQDGARWPEGVELRTKSTRRKDDSTLTRDLHARIAANAATETKPYRMTIPGTDAAFEMLPVPGGGFEMGSPDSEEGHRKDEAPVHKVRVEPFWMGKYEVTWDEYRLFMFAENQTDPLIDAVSRPTRPYVEMSFGMGINGYPAISMTHHAANKYAQWLSSRTGHFYRLPTEAEWEYACRAGTTGPYSFGADASKLGDYAWFEGNSNGKYGQVGKKRPNPWGFHDMHGNVMEWTLDGYDPAFYAKSPPLMPWARATAPYPHAVRGGSWNDTADRCRCGARVGSDASWKMQDPQLPKSIWYHTDAQWLGFRLVRPFKVPDAAAMHAYWNNGVEQE
ncbi:MAG: formylglycine-generating enzyme family protein [Acidobacteria bacterium]|nr:formylglycine-generating enzyme family protein [Acidobacteriota bacterium]